MKQKNITQEKLQTLTIFSFLIICIYNYPFLIEKKEFHLLKVTKKKRDQAQWLISVISALWEAEASGSPEVRSLRPAWPTQRNPISTKNTKKKEKIARCGGTRL